MRLPSILAASALSLTVAQAAFEPEGWKEVRAQALRDMRSDDAAVLMEAFDPLREHDHLDAAELLIKTMLSSRSEFVLKNHARDVLGGFRSEECRDHVYQLLRSSPGKSYLLLEAFARMGDGRATEIGQNALRWASKGGRDAEAITAAAIRCLVAAGEPSPEAAALLFSKLGPENPIGARIAAVESLHKVRTPEMVEKLIALLDDVTLGQRAHLMLVRLAGSDAGGEKRDWEFWWGLQAGVVPEGELLGVPEAGELVAARLKAAEEDGSALSFYGIPIEGQNVLFVLDSSGSMEGYPLERLQAECRSLVEKLPETHRFALQFFPGNDGYPTRGLELATGDVKAKAYKFIERRRADGGTPVIDAMEHAYGRYIEKHPVDAIYLLSDGAPSNPIPDVLAKIDELNAGRYIPIHTIYIGKIPQPRAGDRGFDGLPGATVRTGWGFLKEVARRHDGKFNVIEL